MSNRLAEAEGCDAYFAASLLTQVVRVLQTVLNGFNTSPNNDASDVF